MRNHLVLGSWNAICDVCGLKKKSYQLRPRWDGLMVCKDDYETRHEQLEVRVKPETIAPPWVRPEGTDSYALACDLWSSSPMADFGEADCFTVGGNTSIPLLINIFSPSCIAAIAIAGRSIPGVI